MKDFNSWKDAREYFHKFILPNLVLDEEELVEEKIMDWIEGEQINIKEAKELSESDNYDNNNKHEV